MRLVAFRGTDGKLEGPGPEVLARAMPSDPPPTGKFAGVRGAAGIAPSGMGARSQGTSRVAVSSAVAMAMGKAVHLICRCLGGLSKRPMSPTAGPYPSPRSGGTESIHTGGLKRVGVVRRLRMVLRRTRGLCGSRRRRGGRNLPPDPTASLKPALSAHPHDQDERGRDHQGEG